MPTIISFKSSWHYLQTGTIYRLALFTDWHYLQTGTIYRHICSVRSIGYTYHVKLQQLQQKQDLRNSYRRTEIVSV